MINFFAKKLLESKMNDVPQEQKEKFFSMLEKNPELFQKIALEAQEKIKGGMSQMDAVMAVIKKYEGELKGLE